MAMHGSGDASPWVQRWAHLVRPGGHVLDVACGSGRHLRWLAAQGFRVTGVDRDAAALAGLATLGETIVADIEGGPWPLAGRRFDAVVVTNYLWRPLAGVLREALAEGGLYLHETFADGNAAYGRPSRPEFLLREGELLEMTRGLHVVAYEHGLLDDPPRVVQRVAALAAPGPHPLGG